MGEDVSIRWSASNAASRESEIVDTVPRGANFPMGTIFRTVVVDLQCPSDDTVVVHRPPSSARQRLDQTSAPTSPKKSTTPCVRQSHARSVEKKKAPSDSAHVSLTSGAICGATLETKSRPRQALLKARANSIGDAVVVRQESSDSKIVTASPSRIPVMVAKFNEPIDKSENRADQTSTVRSKVLGTKKMSAVRQQNKVPSTVVNPEYRTFLQKINDDMLMNGTASADDLVCSQSGANEREHDVHTWPSAPHGSNFDQHEATCAANSISAPTDIDDTKGRTAVDADESLKYYYGESDDVANKIEDPDAALENIEELIQSSEAMVSEATAYG